MSKQIRKLVPVPLLVSAHRQKTFSAYAKVKSDKARVCRGLGTCSPALYTVAGKNTPLF